jgi:capsular polysaccharide synthesis protein
MEFPKKLWSLWLDEPATPPPLVRLAFDCWQRSNPDWNFQVLSRGDLPALLRDYPDHVLDLPAAALSDIVRIELLARYGGVWTDSSVIPSKPLNTWLPGLMTHGFFAFEKPGPDRPIASWFLAAQKAHPIVLKWRQEVFRYWQRPRKLVMDPRNGNPFVENPFEMVANGSAENQPDYPYFWFHYLFGYLETVDTDFYEAWRTCARVSARPPHKLQHLIRNKPDEPPAGIWEVYLSNAPLHKLDWRLNVPKHLEERIRENTL